MEWTGTKPVGMSVDRTDSFPALHLEFYEEALERGSRGKKKRINEVNIVHELW
jgi:hypothetical protein